MTLRSLRRAAALAAALTTAAAAGEMRTTNGMLWDASTCIDAPCPQGALFADALVYRSGGAATIGIAAGDDFGWGGWAAGVVSDSRAIALHGQGGAECVAKLNGSSIVKIMEAVVSGNTLAGDNAAATTNLMLQFNGLRVIYSTTLPAPKRLLGVLVWDTTANDFRHLDRGAIYGVAMLRHLAEEQAPYKQWTAGTGEGESLTCGAAVAKQGDVVKDFLANNSPYTIPEPKNRIVGVARAALHTPKDCVPLSPPHRFDTGTQSCIPVVVGPPGTQVIVASAGNSAAGAATAAATGVAAAVMAVLV